MAATLYPEFLSGWSLDIGGGAGKYLFLKSLLPGSQIPWGIVHVEMKDLALLATATGMGASFVRVGFEDSQYYAPDKIATTNAELVEKIVALIRQMGHEIATPEEARELFGMKKLNPDTTPE
ncbi:3-keto-5-aminohexanoate cleavage protein [Thermodesulfobacteriota bacterium]